MAETKKISNRGMIEELFYSLPFQSEENGRVKKSDAVAVVFDCYNIAIGIYEGISDDLYVILSNATAVYGADEQKDTITQPVEFRKIERFVKFEVCLYDISAISKVEINDSKRYTSEEIQEELGKDAK
jgi:hypothetical protein